MGNNNNTYVIFAALGSLLFKVEKSLNKKCVIKNNKLNCCYIREFIAQIRKTINQIRKYLNGGYICQRIVLHHTIKEEKFIIINQMFL